MNLIFVYLTFYRITNCEAVSKWPTIYLDHKI